MPARKRASQGEDAQPLPVREKRRRVSQVQDEEDLENSLSHIEEPIARRGLRSNPAADIPIRLGTAGSPEVSQNGFDQAPVPKKSHVKFGSESPPPVPEIEAENAMDAEAEVKEDEEEDSDDDAPEAISHSAAEAETKAAAAEEARLLKKQERDQREKRRKRDVQLKEQVKKSDKRKQAKEDGKTSKKQKYDLDNLPNFLPEELLAIEAPVRPPTPPFEDKSLSKMKKSIGQRRERSRAEERPIEAIHKGSKIRVLQTTSSKLPPKANTGVDNIRENWMQGRAAFMKKGKRGSNVAQFRRRTGPAAFV